jgi:two-component system, OmpR family, sensor histidine kinase MprB
MSQQGAKHRTSMKKAGSSEYQAETGRKRSGLTGMSLRTRVSLLVMAAVGVTVMVAAIVSYFAISKAVTNQLDDNLSNQATALQLETLNGQQMSVGTTGLYAAGLQETILSSNGQASPPLTLTIINSSANGPEPATHINMTAPWGAPELAVAQGTSQQSVRTVTESTGAYRVIAVPYKFAPNSALVLATSMAPTQNTLRILRLVSSLVGLIGIGIAGIAGLWIGRTALRPVERLTMATEYIARTGDLQQIEVTGDDELARLTESFNTMLLALARSREYQKRLVADAGHELRTPLTSIRTNLDLLAQATAEPDNPRLSADDRAELMSDVRAQMEELSILIADLVELSRDERPTHAVELIDFADVVDRAVQRVQRRAPSLVYDIELESWFLNGEPAALERMVTNLLDNAAKWSPPGGTLTVRLHEGALRVADQGPGIAEQDLKHVFERFYRSPEARTMPGSGLGLAIVRQVAENHGGRVAAARAQGGGALLGVWLPGNPGPTTEEFEPLAELEPASNGGQLSPVEMLGTAAVESPVYIPDIDSTVPDLLEEPEEYELEPFPDAPPTPSLPPSEGPPSGASPPPNGEPSGATRTAPGPTGP